MKKFLALLLLAAFVLFFVGCEAVTGGGGDLFVNEPVIEIPGKWVVMVWLDGDNYLEEYALNDFNEMEEGLYKAIQKNSNVENDIKIIVQLDRTIGYDDTLGNWTDTRRYLIKPDSNTNDNQIRSERLDTGLDELGEINMGDPSNLKSFISDCKGEYGEGYNYALILWNHGGGVRGTERSSISDSKNISKAVCWDYDNGEDCLYVGEITDVLTDDEDVDLIGFDACLMGMAEVAYEYGPNEDDEPNKFNANFMAASPATEQGDGWEYQNLFSCFTGGIDDGSVPAELFAKAVVAEYKRAFYYYSGETMSAYDLGWIYNVKAALDNLAGEITNDRTVVENIRGNFPSTSIIEYFDQRSVSEWINYPHFDLYDFASKVSSNSSLPAAARAAADTLKTAVDTCVIKSWAGSSYSGHTVGTDGLGFFFPDGDYSGSGYENLYYYQWWYTNEDTDIWWGAQNPTNRYYGKLDFCNSDGDGSVEGWRELLEYWFDNGTLYTPSSF